MPNWMNTQTSFWLISLPTIFYCYFFGCAWYCILQFSLTNVTIVCLWFLITSKLVPLVVAKKPFWLIQWSQIEIECDFYWNQMIFFCQPPVTFVTCSLRLHALCLYVVAPGEAHGAGKRVTGEENRVGNSRAANQNWWTVEDQQRERQRDPGATRQS